MTYSHEFWPFKTSGRVVGIAAGLLTAAPASALACPVCGLVGPSDNTWAYQAMTAMLTLLPLAMVGALVWWLARLAARADTERPSATQHASTAHWSMRPRCTLWSREWTN